MTNSKYGVTAADNISGFLEGDISKGNIQYGVKAKGATALGYMDIIRYAQEILAAPDLILATFFNKKAAGGVFNTKSKVLSS